jgi:hypothetical protein
MQSLSASVWHGTKNAPKMHHVFRVLCAEQTFLGANKDTGAQLSSSHLISSAGLPVFSGGSATFVKQRRGLAHRHSLVIAYALG